MEIERTRPGDRQLESEAPPRKRPQIVEIESTASNDEGEDAEASKYPK